jgi:hypothetical protein
MPVTGAAFWALMDRWGIPDDQALRLIERPPSASGRRSQFALSTDQAEWLDQLREIDLYASGVYQKAGGWLTAKPKLSVRWPVAACLHDPGRRDGIETVLRRVHLMALGGRWPTSGAAGGLAPVPSLRQFPAH